MLLRIQIQMQLQLELKIRPLYLTEKWANAMFTGTCLRLFPATKESYQDRSYFIMTIKLQKTAPDLLERRHNPKATSLHQWSLYTELPSVWTSWTNNISEISELSIQQLLHKTPTSWTQGSQITMSTILHRRWKQKTKKPNKMPTINDLQDMQHKVHQ